MGLTTMKEIKRRRIVIVVDIGTDKQDELHGNALADGLIMAIEKIGEVHDLVVYEQGDKEDITCVFQKALDDVKDGYLK